MENEKNGERKNGKYEKNGKMEKTEKTKGVWLGFLVVNDPLRRSKPQMKLNISYQ